VNVESCGIFTVRIRHGNVVFWPSSVLQEHVSQQKPRHVAAVNCARLSRSETQLFGPDTLKYRARHTREYFAIPGPRVDAGHAADKEGCRCRLCAVLAAGGTHTVIPHVLRLPCRPIEKKPREEGTRGTNAGNQPARFTHPRCNTSICNQPASRHNRRRQGKISNRPQQPVAARIAMLTQ
jgi:hypothetical protein